MGKDIYQKINWLGWPGNIDDIMNMKQIHSFQQKKGSEKKAEIISGEKRKRISINSVITKAKQREPRAERQFFPCSSESIV